MKYFLGIVLAFFARRVKNDYAAATVRDPFESFQEESHPLEQNREISFSICRSYDEFPLIAICFFIRAFLFFVSYFFLFFFFFDLSFNLTITNDSRTFTGLFVD